MIIIAGITRSGLTLTMQMLNAGGHPCAGEYPAFEPYGIGDVPWWALKGKAVKLVDAHRQLPRKLKRQKVILFTRDLRQQAKSINKFLCFFNAVPPQSEASVIKSLKKDYATINKWAKKQIVITLKFEDILKDPMVASQKIAKFSGKDLDVDKMSAAVIPRASECYPGLLEARMV